jgi:hypothetical protein
VFPLTNFSNGKQIQKSLESDFSEKWIPKNKHRLKIHIYKVNTFKAK